jgi:16S rRNA (guanine966-N2)-methyltransferase
VLDCFAGAGGLGLEAASREARHVTLVDSSRKAASNLTAQVKRLGTDNVEVYHGRVQDFLQHCDRLFDIVFLDPPYAQPGLRQQTLELLIAQNLLKPGARIYLEWPRQEQKPLNDINLDWIRQKTAGQVTYAIAQWRLSG